MQPVWHAADPRVGIRKLTVGPIENNVYIVACRHSGRALVVDAASEPERIAAALADLSPVAIVTTHGHWDHIGAAAELCRRLGVPWRIHPADAEQAGREPDEPLADGELITVGELAVTVIHHPGHTPGSVSFHLPGHLFTGDTLFPGGPGMTTGPEEFSQIMIGIETRLMTFDDDTVVHPGHGLDTTLGNERSQLGAWRARGF